MSITVIDYGSGNLKSAAKALEAAANNLNLNLKVIVTSDPKIIKESKKIIKVIGEEFIMNNAIAKNKRCQCHCDPLPFTYA